MSEPQTEAGRRLLRIIEDFAAHPTMDIREVVRLNIGTIEAEARAAGQPSAELFAYRQPYTAAGLVLSEKLGPNNLWLGEILAVEDEMEARAPVRTDDLRAAVEIMATKVTPYGEREDGTTTAYIIGDSTWHRVLAIARGSVSDAARAAINYHREARQQGREALSADGDSRPEEPPE